VNYEAIATWSQVISSILFIGVLVWLFRTFLVPLVLAAQKAKNEEIARAERRRDEAKAALEALQVGTGAAQRDAAAIRDRALAQAQREQEVALVQAKESGERALRNAQGELARARAAARVALRAELASGALELARKEASLRIDGSLNARLVERFVQFVERRALN